jgi:hypothetical protein
MYDPQDLKPAERQFKRLIDLAERIIDPELLRGLYTCSLFLFTAEKTQKALAWNRERPDPLSRIPGYATNPPVLPVVVADDESAVWLIQITSNRLVAVTCREMNNQAALAAVYISGLIDLTAGGLNAMTIVGRCCEIHESAAKERRYFFLDQLCTEWVGGNATNRQIEQFGYDLCTHADTALIQLDYASKARQTVIEETPPTVIRNPGGKHIPRASERPRIIVLDPDEVLHLRKHPSSPPQGGHHATPAAHLRRAHQRTLRAERWKKKRGQTIEIDAMMICPEMAWTVGRTTYKVVNLQPKKSGDDSRQNTP